MKRGKRLLAVLLALIMMIGMAPAAFAASTSFSDVSSSAWYYEPVQWAVENGITGGTGANTFSPDAACTRGQVVMFLWRANGSPEPESLMNYFSDVTVYDYFYKAVLWAVEKGITGGIGDGKFGPNQPCTRAQVATFLWRAQGSPIAMDQNNPFFDVNPDDYYFNSVLWAVENGITGGVGYGNFGSDQTCTRGQIVTFLYKADQIDSEPEPNQINITFSSVFQPEERLGQAGEKLAEMITERTGSAVTVTYYGQNQKECYGDSVAKAVAGEYWMGLEEPTLFADYVGDCAVLVGPMLYASNEEYNYVMESEIVQAIMERLASKHNIHILDTHYTFGFRDVYTNKVITTPEDLNGMVLRATSSALYTKTLESLGATPQAMGFTEAISAMSNGVIQGYEGSVSTHKDTGVYEFIHNGAQTNHLIAARWLFISENVWQQIPAEYQTIIEECAAECGKWAQDAVAADEAEMMAFLEENGTSYNDVDLDAFTEACEPVFDWIVDEYGADPTLRGKIVDMVKAYRGENSPTNIAP